MHQEMTRHSQEITSHGKEIESILSMNAAEAASRLFQAYQLAYDKGAFAAALVAALVLERNLRIQTHR